MSKLRVGSRASLLAVTQTKQLLEKLQAHHADLQIEHILITTTGDRDQNSSLSQMGGKGVFVKEIEDALLENKIDLAVHSLKDVPQVLPAGLILGPFPEREDPRDAVVSRFGELLGELPKGSTVGTSSPRRRAQVLSRYKKRSYHVVDLRGNLDTRLKKLHAGDIDSMIVAAAGLKRLGLEGEITHILEPEEMMPAPGQGCLALELRADDRATLDLLQSVKHTASDIKARAERAFLMAIGGNCTVPLGSHIEIIDDELLMKAMLLSPTGDRHIQVTEVGSLESPELVGAKCAGRLLFEGGTELL